MKTIIEEDVERWFKDNYKSLGFERIEPNKKFNVAIKNYYTEATYKGRSPEFPFWLKGKGEKICPDFFGFKEVKKYGIELEVKASNFIRHRHPPSKVDLLIVFKDDSKRDFPLKKSQIISLLKLNQQSLQKKIKFDNLLR